MSATKRSGIASLADDDFSVVDAIGGPLGVVESLLPGLVFVILFVVTRDLRLTVVVSAIPAVLQLLIRLLRRQTPMGAISGMASVGICLVWAWVSRDARNYYMPGFLTNVLWLLALGVTLALRTPGIGLIVEFVRRPVFSGFRDWLNDWRSDPALRRAYAQATLMWAAVFALRLIVQVPLYLGRSVGWLGTARLVMGVPLWALTIWLSWLLIAGPMRRHAAAERSHDEPDDESGDE